MNARVTYQEQSCSEKHNISFWPLSLKQKMQHQHYNFSATNPLHTLGCIGIERRHIEPHLQLKELSNHISRGLLITTILDDECLQFSLQVHSTKLAVPKKWMKGAKTNMYWQSLSFLVLALPITANKCKCIKWIEDDIAVDREPHIIWSQPGSVPPKLQIF